ncbi:DNA polymerase/3'-5' exonuclease PolX [Thiohalorhabdus methylotrophus]|uniref:DNA polymerase beta n=1 Tax=Thiohalorhabdus methylotrophus TaxID=3242694 RepID=A0ABV4TUD5_9GAMM
MPVHNHEIAERFTRLANLLEIEGENPYRVRAYRNAARTIGGLSANIADLVSEEQDLTRYPGIGKDLAAKIRTLVRSGELPDLTETEERVPTELSDLMVIEGLGPKGVRALYKKLNVDSLEDLEEAARAGRIHEVERFGEKTEKAILEEIEKIRSGGKKRTRLADAEEVARPLVAYLAEAEGVEAIEVAGSFRRRKETVGDLDILASCGDSGPVMERFVTHEDVTEVVSRGSTRSTVRLSSGMDVDLRAIHGRSYGAALHYFTGSQAHNIAVRQRGLERGYKVNEYGIFAHDRDEEPVAGATEEEVYGRVDLPWIPPELREDRGEIQAAEKGALPRLVTRKALRGDLHAHTNATDGADSLRDMARAAAEAGHEYLAITDHSKRVSMAHGLDADRLRRQGEEIDRLNEELNGITLLKGSEVDILEDGRLDLPDDVLAGLDVTVCSIHYRFNLPRDKQTDRIIRAMDNPHFRILGHPSGRAINEREPFELDMERLVEAAAERHCALEVNAQPARLDLRDMDCMLARERGAKLVLSTDAHNTYNLGLLGYAVDQARRGWAEAGDVINTRGLEDLRALLRRG